jgi:hypothetical protein
VRLDRDAELAGVPVASDDGVCQGRLS